MTPEQSKDLYIDLLEVLEKYHVEKDLKAIEVIVTASGILGAFTGTFLKKESFEAAKNSVNKAFDAGIEFSTQNMGQIV